MIYEEKKNTHRVACTSFVFGGKLFNRYFFIYLWKIYLFPVFGNWMLRKNKLENLFFFFFLGSKSLISLWGTIAHPTKKKKGSQAMLYQKRVD